MRSFADATAFSRLLYHSVGSGMSIVSPSMVVIASAMRQSHSPQPNATRVIASAARQSRSPHPVSSRSGIRDPFHFLADFFPPCIPGLGAVSPGVIASAARQSRFPSPNPGLSFPGVETRESRIWRRRALSLRKRETKEGFSKSPSPSLHRVLS